MRKVLFAVVAAVGVLGCIGSAFAVIGETTVVATGGGQPLQQAKITLTFKSETGKVIHRTTTTSQRKIRIPDGTRKVDITVTTGGRTETRTDVDVDWLVGHDFPIDVPGGSTPVGEPAGVPTGPYIGVSGGLMTTGCNNWTTTQIFSLGSSDPVRSDNNACFSSGFQASVNVGYSWMRSERWLVGVETDIGYATNRKTSGGVPGASTSANDSVSVKESWNGSLRGRLGYLIAPRTVLYTTAGLAWQRLEATVNCTAATPCGRGGVGVTPFSATNSTTRLGWTLGAGVEYALAGNWRARGEYRYADYGTYTATYGSVSNAAITSDLSLRTHMVTVGLTYAFAGH